jgi:hypothetical protein
MFLSRFYTSLGWEKGRLDALQATSKYFWRELTAEQ